MKFIDLKSLDKRSRIEVFITALMVIVFVLIFVNSIRKILASKQQSTGINYISADTFKDMIRRDGIAADTSQVKEQNPYQDAIAQEDLLPWGRDPFSEKGSLIGQDTGISDLKLEGILLHHGSHPQAIINGEMVGKGDTIATVTIVDIEKDEVTVSDGEKQYKLRLW